MQVLVSSVLLLHPLGVQGGGETGLLCTSHVFAVYCHVRWECIPGELPFLQGPNQVKLSWQLIPHETKHDCLAFHRENSRIQCAFKELWQNKEHMNIRRRKRECGSWEIQKPTRGLQDKVEIQRLPCHTQGLSFCHIIPYFIHKQQAQCCTSCSLHAEYNNVCVYIGLLTNSSLFPCFYGDEVLGCWSAGQILELIILDSDDGITILCLTG